MTSKLCNVFSCLYKHKQVPYKDKDLSETQEQSDIEVPAVHFTD